MCEMSDLLDFQLFTVAENPRLVFTGGTMEVSTSHEAVCDDGSADNSWKNCPRGRPKSGRLWKDPKPPRLVGMYYMQHLFIILQVVVDILQWSLILLNTCDWSFMGLMTALLSILHLNNKILHIQKFYCESFDICCVFFSHPVSFYCDSIKYITFHFLKISSVL